jgi:hypothetical protein
MNCNNTFILKEIGEGSKEGRGERRALGGNGFHKKQ